MASSKTRRLFVYDKTNNLKFLIDTGADISVLPFNVSSKQISQPNFQLAAANGTSISTYGTKFLNVNLGLRRSFPHLFIIASVNRPILGADFLTKFNLLVDLANKQLIDAKTSISITAVSVESVDTPTPLHFTATSKFNSLLSKFPSLTLEPSANSPIRHNVMHHIVTEGQLPFAKPRRLDPKRRKAAKHEFEQGPFRYLSTIVFLCRLSFTYGSKEPGRLATVWRLPWSKFHHSTGSVSDSTFA